MALERLTWLTMKIAARTSASPRLTDNSLFYYFRLLAYLADGPTTLKVDEVDVLLANEDAARKVVGCGRALARRAHHL
jgi:hypothetical protein